MRFEDIPNNPCGYKVPGRQVYCGTLRTWLASTIYCYVVLKLNPYHY